MPNDTSPETDAQMRMLMSKRTPAERLRMATDMADAGRTLLRAGLKEQHPTATEARLRGLVFMRLYGDQFTWQEAVRIAATMPNMEIDDSCRRLCRADPPAAPGEPTNRRTF